jgi:fructokinase
LPWPSPDDEAPDCYCGKRGCIETHLSGAGMARDHRRRTGIGLSAQQIAAAADQGDSAARATLAAYIERLGKALATVVNVLDPDVVVLGGGISNIDALYAPELAAALSRHAFSDGVSTPVKRAHHGDSSGVRGAAWLWGP